MEAIRSSYKNTILGKIPSDWRIKKIAEVTEILDNKRVPLNSTQRKKMAGDIPYYGANGMVDKVNDFIFDEPLILMAEDGGNFSDYEKRSIAYKIFGKSWVNNHAHVLKPKDDFCFDFIFYELEHKNIIRFINGSTRTKLNQGDLKLIPIRIPPIPEQRKIAEILSAVDKQISDTEGIIEKSKELKKGLMQKLFSEGIGHTEFKDTKIGRIPKDWEVVKIGDITNIKVGRDLKEERHSEVKTEKHKYPIFSNTVSNYGLYGYYDFPEYEGRSLTIVGRGVGIGTSFPRTGGYGAIGRLLVLFPQEDVNEVFLSSYVNAKMKIHKEDGAIPQLTGAKVSSYKVVKPPLDEQNRIADILIEADKKIGREEQYKSELEQLKKGLMQQLLTGKKRVKV